MELSHTLEVRPNLFIRAFLKFYGMAPPYDLNTCKLFWGTIGMVVIPPTLLVMAPFIGLAVLSELLQDSRARAKSQRREAFYALSLEERDALAKARLSRSERLDKFSARAGAVWFKVQGTVTWFFRFVIGAIALGCIAYLVVVLINVVPGLPWGDILSIAWKVVLGAIAVLVIAYFLARAFLAWQARRPISPIAKPKKPSVIKATFASIHDHTCANIKVTRDV